MKILTESSRVNQSFKGQARSDIFKQHQTQEDKINQTGSYWVIHTYMKSYRVIQSHRNSNRVTLSIQIQTYSHTGSYISIQSHTYLFMHSLTKYYNVLQQFWFDLEVGELVMSWAYLRNIFGISKACLRHI